MCRDSFIAFLTYFRGPFPGVFLPHLYKMGKRLTSSSSSLQRDCFISKPAVAARAFSGPAPGRVRAFFLVSGCRCPPFSCPWYKQKPIYSPCRKHLWQYRITPLGLLRELPLFSPSPSYAKGLPPPPPPLWSNEISPLFFYAAFLQGRRSLSFSLPPDCFASSRASAGRRCPTERSAQMNHLNELD